MSLRKKKLLILPAFFLLLILNLIFISHAYAKHSQMVYNYQIFDEIGDATLVDNTISGSHAPLVLGAKIDSTIEVGDARSATLKYFFRKYNSPLYEEAEYIVAVSDLYGFDYRLLPAIAMQESGLCKFIPENSYNCWGYGIYGDNVIRFDSYRDGIRVVAAGLKKNYIDKGLTTPEAIMSKYTPSSNGSWANGVLWVLNQLK